MKKGRHDQVSELFLRAVEVDARERDAWLDEHCGGDAELCRDVEELLAADAKGAMLPDDDSHPVQPASSAEEPDLAGRTLSHYRIIEKIGTGGMATVYRAEDFKLKRLVALKVMTPSWTEQASARARFLREAQAAAALDHPNICTVYEIDQADGYDFITMSYLEGQTLADRIDAGPISIPDAVDIALQAARGLQAAHEKGVVHRDIKPGNLMLLKSGVVKIMDFGVAYFHEGQSLTKSGLTMGTAAYMSPEQIESSKVDGRSDIWSLGVVLYQMLSRRLPFQRGSTREVLAAIMAAKLPPLLEIRGDLPPALTALVDKALSKDPSHRYQSSELGAGLQELDDQLRTGRRGADDLPAYRRDAARFRRRAILAAAAATAAALVLAFMNPMAARARRSPRRLSQFRSRRTLAMRTIRSCRRMPRESP